MVEISVRITNLEEIQEDFTRLGIYLRGAIANALEEAADVVKSAAIPNVRKRTGKTRASIESAVDKQGLKAYVGSNWFVSRFLERGTKRMRAYPFLRPAIDKNEGRIREILISNLNRAIIKVKKGT